ncbi:MAG: ABC transporter ATP-binding protein [Thiotrichaceae bacterium]|nr:ABC transporter ATP-binding protein [Thiotrichaceae bacterium]
MPAISIQQVHKHYKQLHALKGINFDIPEGSFFGLLGPNGAGKSTLISIMAGLVKASSGSIRIQGHDVRKQWRQARQAMGVVPQELVYDPFFTIKELFRLQSGYFGLGRENEVWLDELLEILSLTDKANTNMSALSGGMKRRVLIGQALVHKPSVVILDEPTAGVDLELRKMLWEFATQLHDKGHTIVLTTHYLEEAESLCDRIAILNHGEVVALDDKHALLARYPYRLLCLSLEKPVSIPSQLQDKVQSFEDNQLVLRLHREHDTVNDVLESLRSAQINFVDLHTQEPGLEEVFMSLTHKKTNS